MKAPARCTGKTHTSNILGWREWAALPDLGVGAIKVKLDTGARTSALHAFGLERFMREGTPMVRFEVHPVQRSSAASVSVEAKVLDERVVRTSSGHEALRPVINTIVQIGHQAWPIELTLARRDQMGFRMLLGRQALRNRVVVDSGTSFRAGRHPAAPFAEAPIPNRNRSREDPE